MILNDHDDFSIYGEHLKGKRIGFVVTGGVAAYTAPKIIRALRRYSCEVFPYATTEGLRFVTEDTLAWAAKHDVVKELTNKSEHLGQDNETFDAIVVYSATYNFLGKMANGIADDACSSLIASHISHAKIIYMPTMHGNMWASPILKNNLKVLDALENVTRIEPRLENNKANIPDTVTCVTGIVRAISESLLKGVSVLVTAGPTPVKVDNVRYITNKFSGKLGIEIANELYLRGADVMLLQSYSGIRPPKYIKNRLHKDYDEYIASCLELSENYKFGIFTAAVADYMPTTVYEGKIPSKGGMKSIELKETEKVIDLIREKYPELKMISFKYEEGKTLAQMLEIAGKRIKLGHHSVVVNDITLNTDKQKCFYTGLDNLGIPYVVTEAEGKINIARMIANQMEKDV